MQNKDGESMNFGAELYCRSKSRVARFGSGAKFAAGNAEKI